MSLGLSSEGKQEIGRRLLVRFGVLSSLYFRKAELFDIH